LLDWRTNTIVLKKRKKDIAIDLGGTNMRVSVVENNKILRYVKKKTPKSSKLLLDQLSNMIENSLESDIRDIGISSAGPLLNGVIKNPPNLPLKNFNLQRFLEKKFKRRVKIANDAECAALAEFGLGCKKQNFFLLTLGTGIGGGVIINGQIFNGMGYGGELGHLIINDGKDLENLWKEQRSLSRKYFGEGILIKDLIRMKSEKSNKFILDISKYLGQGIASLVGVFDPEVVILSGGVSETGNGFLNKIKKEAKKYNMLPRMPDIKWSRLEHPGTLGASLLVS
jgi:glucokinase